MFIYRNKLIPETWEQTNKIDSIENVDCVAFGMVNYGQEYIRYENLSWVFLSWAAWPDFAVWVTNNDN